MADTDPLKIDFLAALAHELRTPLNGMIGFSEFLLDEAPGPLNDKQKEYLGDVLAGSLQLLGLINDTFDLANLEGGRLEMHPSPFELRAAIEQACVEAAPRAAAKRIQLSPQLASDISVNVDRVRLVQIFRALIVAALEVSATGLEVVVAAEVHGSILAATVSYHGTELRPRDLHKVGMVLARRLVELRGGSLATARDADGHGMLTVTVPVEVSSSLGIHTAGSANAT
ncbi:MAG TPA: HAMP domain-containing sensor histidine kinase [Steroidobacteraceae bacterium]|jgi:signal transduction histidine kinase